VGIRPVARCVAWLLAGLCNVAAAQSDWPKAKSVSILVGFAVNPSLYPNAGYDALKGVAGACEEAAAQLRLFWHRHHYPPVDRAAQDRCRDQHHARALPAGYAEFDDYTWIGLFLPAGVPPSIVERFNADINRALEAADVKERFSQAGLEIVRYTSAEFGVFLKAEVPKWAAVVKSSGAKVE